MAKPRGGRRSTTWKPGEGGGPGSRGQLRRDMTLVLVQQLNEAEEKGNRPKMHAIVGQLIDLALRGGGAVYDKDGKLLKQFGDLEAIKYIFDRLEGRPSQSMHISKESYTQVEFKTYDEIRDGLLQQGIDLERLPLLRDLRDDADDAAKG